MKIEPKVKNDLLLQTLLQKKKVFNLQKLAFGNPFSPITICHFFVMFLYFLFRHDEKNNTDADYTHPCTF